MKQNNDIVKGGLYDHEVGTIVCLGKGTIVGHTAYATVSNGRVFETKDMNYFSSLREDFYEDLKDIDPKVKKMLDHKLGLR